MSETTREEGLSATAVCEGCGEPLAMGVSGGGGICIRCALGSGGEEESLARSGGGPQPGRRLGQFELIEELGRGATGIVFRALEVALSREVAVKVLRLGPWAGEREWERFRREALAVGRLRHPGIVPLLGLHEDDGWLFMVLGLVRGETVAQRLQRGLPTPRTAARWIRDAADAVAHAHHHGVLHRDLKPTNLMLDATDGLFLTDFGTAKLLDLDSKLTDTGQLLGTIHYMAPEQVSSTCGMVGAVTDVYALGGILYECLTGSSPVHGSSVAELIRHITLSDPVSPRRRAGGVPEDLEAICLKCLEKNPAERYAGAAELRDDLDRFLRNEPVTARHHSRFDRAAQLVRRHPAISMLSMALVLTLGVGLVISARQTRLARSMARENFDLLTRNQVSQGMALAQGNNLATSMAWFVEAWKRDAPQEGSDLDQAHRLRISAALARSPQLRGLFPTGSTDPVFAVLADPPLLAVGDRTGLISIWELGDTPRLTQRLEISVPAHSLRWHANGRHLVAAGENPPRGTVVSVWDRLGKGPLRTLELPSGFKCLALSSADLLAAAGFVDGSIQLFGLINPAVVARGAHHSNAVCQLGFSADGRLVLSAGWDHGAVLWDWRGNAVKTRVQHAGYVRQARFLPSETAFVTASDDGSACVWSCADGSRIGAPWIHEGRVLSVDVSPDGRIAATGGADGCVRLWDLATGALMGDPLRNPGVVDQLAFHPDSTHLASGTANGFLSIWSTTSRRPAALTVELVGSGALNWSVDGRVLWVNDHSSQIRKYEIPALPPSHLIHTSARIARHLKLSPDGRSAIFGLEGNSAWLVPRIPELNRGILLQHRTGLREVGFSWDGSQCFTTADDGTARVWRTSDGAPLSPWLEHPDKVRCGVFSADGQWLFTGGDDRQVRRWAAVGGGGTPIGRPHEGRVMHVRASADGRYLATACDTPKPDAVGAAGTHIRLWDLKTQDLVGGGTQPSAAVSDMEFSSDNRWLVAALGNGDVPVYSLEHPSQPVCVLRHPSHVVSARFSGDSKSLLTSSMDGTMRWWELPSARLKRTWKSTFGKRGEWAGQNGRWVSSSWRSSFAALWHVEKFEPISYFDGLGNELSALAVTPDERWAVTADSSRQLRAWPLEPAPFKRTELMRQALLAANHRVEPESGLGAIGPEELLELWQGR